MTNQKLELKEILALIDTCSFDEWDQMTDEQRKSVNFWTLNRYCSAINGDFQQQALALFKTNEYYNKNWNDIRKHEGLLWRLLCATGNGEDIKFHKYLGIKRKQDSKNKSVKLLQEIHPNMKQDEVELLAGLYTKKELKQLAEEYNIDIKL